MTDVSSALALSWSGGKDSALALQALRHMHGIEPRALVTTVTTGYERVSMHGVRRTLIECQAERLGLPLVEIAIPPGCANAVYEDRWLETLAELEVEEVAFGDLFLEDVRHYRESLLARARKLGVFPLWGRETAQLGREFVASGFRAVIACLDPKRLDASFAGREYDAFFLDQLPAEVDPCGERGEFHTFVYAGPGFPEPIACRVGPVVEREGFVFCDIDEA